MATPGPGCDAGPGRSLTAAWRPAATVLVAVERVDQRVRAGVETSRVRVPDPEVQCVQVGVEEEERRPGTGSGRRAVLLGWLGHERAVVVVAARREEPERGVRQRRRLRNAGEHPLEGAELPGVLRGVLVHQDRRLA